MIKFTKEEHKKLLEDEDFMNDVTNYIDSQLDSVTKSKDRALQEKKNLKSELDAFKALGKDASEIADVLDNYDPNAVKKEVNTVEKNYQKKIEGLTSKMDSLTSSMVKSKVDATIAEAVTKHKGNKFLPRILKEFVSGEYDVDTGDARVKVVDADGVETDLDGLLSDMKKNTDDYGAFFQASVKNGSGAGQQLPTTTNPNGSSIFDKNSEDFDMNKVHEYVIKNPEKAEEVANMLGLPIPTGAKA